MTSKIYTANFTGVDGHSIGLFVIGKNYITGVDTGGVTYEGYIHKMDDGSYDGTIKFIVPAGTTLITGMTASEDQEISMSFCLPKKFDDGKTIVRIETPTGPINAIFNYVRDVPS